MQCDYTVFPIMHVIAICTFTLKLYCTLSIVDNIKVKV